MNVDLNIYDIINLLKDSYKNIDFRSALYYKDHNWQRILSIFRFSNETKTAIKNKYDQLELRRYKTKNFKIYHEVLEISKWEEKLVELYNEIHEDIDIYDVDEFLFNEKKYNEYQSSFLNDFKGLFSNPSLRFSFYNLISIF